MWYALNCRPNKEETILSQLEAQGFEVFFPRRLEYTKKSKFIKVEPLFPGYIFVKIDLETEALSTFQRMQFTSGLTSFGGRPLFLPDNLIHAIRNRVERINVSIVRLLAGINHTNETDHGETQITGYEALFDKDLTDKDRVKVLLDVLDGSSREESPLI
jgi:transcriptional antiterminator RfaH